MGDGIVWHGVLLRALGAEYGISQLTASGAESSRRFCDRRGFCAAAALTKVIQSQLAESLYVAYNDATSHRPEEPIITQDRALRGRGVWR